MPQPRIDVWGCAFFCLRSCFSGFRFRPREDDNNANAVGLKKSCVRSLKKSCVEITSYHPIFRTQKKRKGASMMRPLITALALTAALATPALSQTRGTQTDQQRSYEPYASGRDTSGYGSYGAVTRSRDGRSIDRRSDVYDVRGAYVGSDPDPLVRDQLRRDPGQGIE
jgi:hypothetical protein